MCLFLHLSVLLADCLKLICSCLFTSTLTLFEKDFSISHFAAFTIPSFYHRSSPKIHNLAVRCVYYWGFFPGYKPNPLQVHISHHHFTWAVGRMLLFTASMHVYTQDMLYWPGISNYLSQTYKTSNLQLIFECFSVTFKTNTIRNNGNLEQTQ